MAPPSLLVKMDPEAPPDAATIERPSALTATESHWEGHDELAVVHEMSAPERVRKVAPPSEEVAREDVHVISPVASTGLQVLTTAATRFPLMEVAMGPQAWRKGGERFPNQNLAHKRGVPHAKRSQLNTRGYGFVAFGFRLLDGNMPITITCVEAAVENPGSRV